MIDPEICICAAILMRDGRIQRGHRHDSCFTTLPKTYGAADVQEQGFVTSRNRFVGREEAMDLMQAVDWISADTHALVRGDILFSEDLY